VCPTLKNKMGKLTLNNFFNSKVFQIFIGIDKDFSVQKLIYSSPLPSNWLMKKVVFSKYFSFDTKLLDKKSCVSQSVFWVHTITKSSLTNDPRKNFQKY
jgi:hypothetical protein